MKFFSGFWRFFGFCWGAALVTLVALLVLPSLCLPFERILPGADEVEHHGESSHDDTPVVCCPSLVCVVPDSHSEYLRVGAERPLSRMSLCSLAPSAPQLEEGVRFRRQGRDPPPSPEPQIHLVPCGLRAPPEAIHA